MSNTEMMAIIKKMENDIKDLTIALEKSNANTEKMFSILNAKLDIFKNLSADAATEVAPTATGASKKLNRPVHFKMLFLEKREEYMNILWTQEEIDAIFEDSEVSNKKRESDKQNKAAALLYAKHIKGNTPEGRSNTFDSIYNQAYN